MTTPSNELVEPLYQATRSAILALWSDHPEHHFYYLALVTIEDGTRPVLTAWSYEALDAEIAALEPTEADLNEARLELKWSYADSPFFDYGAEHFTEVAQLLAERMSPSSWEDPVQLEEELVLRLGAMEAAMARLDGDGVFGTGTARHKVFINAEIMPPEADNLTRAKRLNPPEALHDWLNEATDPAWHTYWSPHHL